MKGENLKWALENIRDDAQILFNGSPNVTIQRVDFSEEGGGYVANIIMAPQDPNTEPATDVETLARRLYKIKESEKKFLEYVRKSARKEELFALAQWAGANARFKIGDIITAKGDGSGTIIRVKKIEGEFSQHCKQPYVVYVGCALTKQFKERKDGWTTCIYDDSPSRNIVKLK